MTRWLLIAAAVIGLVLLAAQLVAFFVPGVEFRPLNF